METREVLAKMSTDSYFHLERYRKLLIEGILECAEGRFTHKELEKKKTRSLEIIYDNC